GGRRRNSGGRGPLPGAGRDGRRGERRRLLVERATGARLGGRRLAAGDHRLHRCAHLHHLPARGGVAPPAGLRGDHAWRVGCRRPCARRHGPGGGDARPDYEPLGLRPLRRDPARGRRLFRRLAGQQHDLRAGRDELQRGAAGARAGADGPARDRSQSGGMMDDSPQLAFESEQAWEQWLEAHHAESDGVWLKLAKKGAGVPSVSYAEAVTVALCFGWIDSQSKRLDDRFYVQRFTPRRARSKWSKVNCARALELIAQGRMRPAGLREVEAAQADGRWEAAYDPPSTATVPDDLQAALDENPAALAFF